MYKLTSKFIIHFPMNKNFGIIKKQTLKIAEKQEVSFLGKGVLQVVMLTRNCIYSTKPLTTIILVMKQLIIMIGI